MAELLSAPSPLLPSDAPTFLSNPSLPPLTSSSSLSSASSIVSRQSSTRSTSSVVAVPFRTPVRAAAYPSVGLYSAGQHPASQDGYFSSATPLARRAEPEHAQPMLGEEVRPNPARASSSTLSAQPATRPANSRQGSNASIIVVRKTVGDFVFGEVLGEGSYSTVTLVTDKHPPFRSYALKVLDKEHIKREKKIKYVLIERDTLKALDGHPGIVRLYWTFQDAHSLYYVLELAKNGELLKWIKKFGSFAPSSAKYYAAQILSAVEYIHSKGVIHRDLKPENILLNEHMRVKITDFGTAKVLTGEEENDGETSTKTRSFVGTPEYVSPEILSEKKQSSRSSDYWGFGCILFQIIAGRPPFQARTEYLMFRKIIQLEYEFPDGFPEDAKDLIQKLLVLDPTERLGGNEKGIEAIKSHPYFSSIDFSTIWTVSPPEIETGITEPKKEEKGEFVLEDFEDSGEHDSEGLADVEDVTVGRSGGSSWTGVVEVPKSEPITKWTGVLLPTETIILASPILDRTAFFPKKRTLILTDYPRLICIKEALAKVTLKSEVLIAPAKKGSPTQASFVRTETEGERGFTVKTSQRTYKYEEPSGSAGKWVSEIRAAHLNGMTPEGRVDT